MRPVTPLVSSCCLSSHMLTTIRIVIQRVDIESGDEAGVERLPGVNVAQDGHGLSFALMKVRGRDADRSNMNQGRAKIRRSGHHAGLP